MQKIYQKFVKNYHNLIFFLKKGKKMRVTIVGNKCTWEKELSTSFIVNDDILIDIPQGSFKTLYHDYDLLKTRYILITHFHSDHFADLHLVIDILERFNIKLIILAPKTCKDRLVNILYTFEVSRLKKYVDENITFLECENGKTYKIGNYKVKAYKMIHGELDAYGFVIDDGNFKIGFSGDTCMCNNLHKIIKHSKAVFIDCAKAEVGLNHLTAEEVKGLQDEYKDVIFYPVHLSKATIHKIAPLVLNETYQGQVVEIK